jgi:hypothetical protein
MPNTDCKGLNIDEEDSSISGEIVIDVNEELAEKLVNDSYHPNMTND